MRNITCCFLLTFAASVLGADTNLISNGGFENGFQGWTRWGKNSGLITLDRKSSHSGTNAASIQHGHNALFFSIKPSAEKALEVSFYYRLVGEAPAAQLAVNYSVEGGPLRSAGVEKFNIAPDQGGASNWTLFRRTFLPPTAAASAQFAFTADPGATLYLDDVSLREVSSPPGLTAPPAPWDGLKHRTQNPLFSELLTAEPGHYPIISWAHDLNRKQRHRDSFKSDALRDDQAWLKEVAAIFKESGEAGMGFLDLPGRLDGREPWRNAEFHRKQFEQYGVRYDVWSEGSASIAAALNHGAELLNPSAAQLGRKRSVCIVDPTYVSTQEQDLKKLAEQLRGYSFVGVYYGKDEPAVHLPEGKPETWGTFSRTMAEEVKRDYGFGRFTVPSASKKSVTLDADTPWRWIAFHRWANDKFIASRCRLSKALHDADPNARYSPADYWFMSGFVPYDFSRLAECSDLMELDPYASSAEQTRGRGVFNHGFGAKFMSDLTGKPVRIVAQAFDYAGYKMNPEDLREWVSQAMRCGASAIDYYDMDSPRWTAPDRWKMMLHLSHTITRMNRVELPRDPDTAVIYTLYTHMAMGQSTPANQLYAAHALIGERAGSWFKFVSDAQLERGAAGLAGYKTIYLPLAKYMTPQGAQKIEDAVRAGAILICADADAFSFDLAGNSTAEVHERILGIKTLAPKTADKIILKTARWGLPANTSLPLFETKLWDQTSRGQAREVRADNSCEIFAQYPDGSPAIVSHALGKGRVITFAANPFAPQVTVENTPWPTAFKGLQTSAGCQVDRKIWRFVIP